MPTSSQKILVVGGAGFIGSHMVLALQQAGYTPIVLDNLSTGYKESVLDAELIIGDMADKKLVTSIFQQHQITAVMHFAAFIEVGESVKNPAKYYQNNLLGTVNLLDAMLKNNVKQIVFSSTAAVYGEPQQVPITESHSCLPINPYGRSKWMVEEILKDYARSDGLRFACLRYFNAAGADPEGRLGERHQPESHLIPLVLQAATGERENITIYGDDYATQDGSCVRDYIHVSDLCEAHLLALNALASQSSNIICNLGTGHGYSVKEVISTVQEVTHSQIPIIQGARRAGDPAVLVADASLAKELLGWQAVNSNLQNIVEDAWYFYKNQFSKVSF